MKRGFSLIEVVFSIVIIAISLMSVPMLLKESAKSNEFSMMQEAILATSTKMGNILSYSWDKNSYDNTNKILRILDVSTSGDSELKRVIGTKNSNLRIGNIFSNKRRRFFDFINPGITTPDTTVTSTNKKSINDFHGETTGIVGTGAFDYKDASMSMTSNVYYINDSANYTQTNLSANIISTTTNPITSNLNSTNIKMVQVQTAMPSLGQRIVLKSYLSNIGESKLLTRTK